MPKGSVAEFYVFFTGKTSIPSKISLRRDSLGDGVFPIDLEAKVLFTETEDIIGQYITFSRVIKEQVKVYGQRKPHGLRSVYVATGEF